MSCKATSASRLAAVLVVALLTLAFLTSCAAVKQTASNSISSGGSQAVSDPAGNQGNAGPLTKRAMPAFLPTSSSGETTDNPGYTYEGIPSAPDYIVEAGLTNIENLLQFTTGYPGKDWEGNDIFGFWQATSLSEEAMNLIEQNGFAVSHQKNWREFFDLYENNRRNCVPNFITTDSALHSLHLAFEYVLQELEQQRLFEVLSILSHNLVVACDAQYQALLETEFANAALRNVAFFAVAASLLEADFPVPVYVASLVNQELALITEQAGIGASPVINTGQTYTDSSQIYLADYSQFTPRSHYTLTAELGAYFKAMIWYGQMTFRSSQADEVRSALLQVSALQDPDLASLWEAIFEPVNFLVGECDDITWSQYMEALSDIYGGRFVDLLALTEPESFARALEAIRKLAPPAINSIPVFYDEMQPDLEAATTGYRFLGQRFTIDGVIMQRLVERETKDRMLPKALDIPAALGSVEAYTILADEGEFARYPQLVENMAKVREYIGEVDEETWRSNLYWSWLNMFRSLTGPQTGQGIPIFMSNQAWLRKDLNTFLGSWTELKHDTLLYSKGPLTGKGAGPLEPPPPPDDRGYVEPNPELFGRLATLCSYFITSLEQRGLLTRTAFSPLNMLEHLTDNLRIIAEKELADQMLTEAEYELIRQYGNAIMAIFDIAKEDAIKALGGGFERESYLAQHPSGIVADVATDADGSVLQQATGFVKEIYLAFPRDGKVVLGCGAVYSHYEIILPLTQRMSDETWHQRLNDGDIPATEEWKTAFIADLPQK
ncbi:MAG: DUF3160 domain-containing protein [Symbiobacteriaceae bacterium]|nr:DUF3160 domain-containing protein [Symbiobacteriaceae bacterium]